MQLQDLGPIFIRIAKFDYFKEMMEKVLLFKEIAQEGAFHLFEVGEGGNGAQVVVEYNAILPQAQTRFWNSSPCCIPCRRSISIRRMD